MRYARGARRLAAAVLLAVLLTAQAAALPDTDISGTAAAGTSSVTGIATTAGTDTTTTGTDTTTTGTDTTAPTEAVQPPVEPPAEPPVGSRLLFAADAPWGEGVTAYRSGAELAFEDAVWGNGREGQPALLLDGNTYLDIALDAPKAPFTLTMWVNWQTDLAADTAVGQRIFTLMKRDSDNVLYCAPLMRQGVGADCLNGIQLAAECFAGGEWRQLRLYYPTSPQVCSALPVGSWHHLALAVREQELALYIDGVLWNSGETDFAFADLRADTLLLGAASGGVCGFEGLMQQVIWYDDALTGVQIRRLAQGDDPFDETVTVSAERFLPVPAPDGVLTDKTYYALTDNGKTAVRTDEGAAFWEHPQLGAGQSAAGTLTVVNRSKHLLQLSLEKISLPEKGTPAWNYLSQLSVTVSDGEKTVYTGAYTELSADTLRIAFESMPYRRRAQYTVTLSRGFDAAGEIADVEVPWVFGCRPAHTASEQPTERRTIWLLLLLPLSAALVAVSVYWAVERRERRFFTVWDPVAANVGKCWRDRIWRPLAARLSPLRQRLTAFLQKCLPHKDGGGGQPDGEEDTDQDGDTL